MSIIYVSCFKGGGVSKNSALYIDSVSLVHCFSLLHSIVAFIQYYYFSIEYEFKFNKISLKSHLVDCGVGGGGAQKMLKTSHVICGRPLTRTTISSSNY